MLDETGDEDAVSIRAVARAAGVTSPSIYLHFADKTELFFAVCEQRFRAFGAVLDDAVAGVDDPVDRVIARGRAYVAFGLQHPEDYRVLFMHKPQAPPESFDTAVMLADTGFLALADDVQRAMDNGSFAPGDPVHSSLALWAAVHGLTSLLITKPAFPWPDDRDALIEATLALALRGLGPA